MADRQEGIIIKGIGGFYTVEAADAVYTCRARGIFRKNGQTPLAGDRVAIRTLGDGEGALEEILPRKNHLVRPPVANLDVLVVVASVTDPAPNTLIMDKMIAMAEDLEIEPVLVINKIDLEDAAWLEAAYRLAGIPVFALSALDAAGIQPLQAYLSGKVSAFTGNSGVGKTSLLNAIDPRLGLETGETSKKLGRGRHTTRTAALYKQPGGGYIVDTAGFSSLDMEKAALIPRERLPYCFREFAPYLPECRFASSCAHVREKGCAVRQAVEEGKIARSRYDSYVAMFEEVKDQKSWMQNPKK